MSFSSENREKTLRFVLTFHGQATDKLPTGYRHITNSRPTVGRQVAYISGKTCRPSVGRLSADCRPTGFLGSSSSQLPNTDSFTLSQRQKMSLTQVYVHVFRAHIGLIDMVIISLSQ